MGRRNVKYKYLWKLQTLLIKTSYLFIFPIKIALKRITTQRNGYQDAF